tara:strand:- start:193 stop:576 length:384 start_codon:yes stop_codon:yes gene_type:complete
MSTLKVGTIKDTAESNASTPSQIFEGRARAWMWYDQRNLVDTYNKYGVTSVTDLNTGHFRMNFANTLSNPCAVGAVSYDSVVSDGTHSDTLALMVTNDYCEGGTFNTQHDYYDCNYCMVAVFSDSNN